MNVRLAIPLLIEEGWTRHQKEVAKPPLTERTGWSRVEPLLKNAFRNITAIPTTPSAPLRWLRIFFLMAQPPLLYQEGNCQPDIHSQLRRPREQKGWCSLHLTFLLLHRVLQHQCVGDDLFAWLYPRNDFLHVSGQHVSSDDFDTFERSVLCCVNPLA